MMHTRRAVLGGAALMALAGCASGGRGWRVGESVPDMAYRDAEDAPHRLSDSADRATFLYFTAKWCVHCRATTPQVAAMWSRLRHDQRISWVVVSYAEQPAITRAWIKDDLGSDMPVADPGRNGRPGIALLNGDILRFGIPVGHVIAPGGQLYFSHVGGGGVAAYETALLAAADRILPRT